MDYKVKIEKISEKVFEKVIQIMVHGEEGDAGPDLITDVIDDTELEALKNILYDYVHGLLLPDGIPDEVNINIICSINDEICSESSSPSATDRLRGQVNKFLMTMKSKAVVLSSGEGVALRNSFLNPLLEGDIIEEGVSVDGGVNPRQHEIVILQNLLRGTNSDILTSLLHATTSDIVNALENVPIHTVSVCLRATRLKPLIYAADIFQHASVSSSENDILYTDSREIIKTIMDSVLDLPSDTKKDGIKNLIEFLGYSNLPEIEKSKAVESVKETKSLLKDTDYEYLAIPKDQERLFLEHMKLKKEHRELIKNLTKDSIPVSKNQNSKLALIKLIDPSGDKSIELMQENITVLLVIAESGIINDILNEIHVVCGGEDNSLKAYLLPLITEEIASKARAAAADVAAANAAADAAADVAADVSTLHKTLSPADVQREGVIIRQKSRNSKPFDEQYWDTKFQRIIVESINHANTRVIVGLVPNFDLNSQTSDFLVNLIKQYLAYIGYDGIRNLLMYGVSDPDLDPDTPTLAEPTKTRKKILSLIESSPECITDSENSYSDFGLQFWLSAKWFSNAIINDMKDTSSTVEETYQSVVSREAASPAASPAASSPGASPAASSVSSPTASSTTFDTASDVSDRLVFATKVPHNLKEWNASCSDCLFIDTGDASDKMVGYSVQSLLDDNQTRKYERYLFNFIIFMKILFPTGFYDGPVVPSREGTGLIRIVKNKSYDKNTIATIFPSGASLIHKFFIRFLRGLNNGYFLNKLLSVAELEASNKVASVDILEYIRILFQGNSSGTSVRKASVDTALRGTPAVAKSPYFALNSLMRTLIGHYAHIFMWCYKKLQDIVKAILTFDKLSFKVEFKGAMVNLYYCIKEGSELIIIDQKRVDTSGFIQGSAIQRSKTASLGSRSSYTNTQSTADDTSSTVSDSSHTSGLGGGINFVKKYNKTKRKTNRKKRKDKRSKKKKYSKKKYSKKKGSKKKGSEKKGSKK